MTATFRVRVADCRYPTHDLNPAHIWPHPHRWTATTEPITVSALDNGQWFVQDGRHRLIRAHLRGDEYIDATDHDQDTPHD